MPQFLTWRGMQSARDSGYKSTTYALAELIDNAFDWGATECRIIFIEQEYDRGGTQVSEIIIADNGQGMTQEVQGICLAMGGGENHDEITRLTNRRIGKFGMGLPQASISQCRITDVFSWQNTSDVRKVTLDFNEIEASKSIEIPEVVDCALPEYFTRNPIGISDKSKSGTIVRWTSCDRLSNVRASTLIRKSEYLLGKIYRYPLSNGKKSISLEHYTRSANRVLIQSDKKKYVKPNDPLYLMEDTSIGQILNELGGDHAVDSKLKEAYGPFLKPGGGCLATSEKLKDFCYEDSFEWARNGPLKSFKYEITTSVVNEKVQKPNMERGGQTKVGAWYANSGCEYKTYQNISFVRSGREIHSGRFQFPIKRGDIPQHRWWHIEIKFDSDLDDLLGVAWNKQAVGFVYTEEQPSHFDELTSDLGTAKEQFQYNLSNKILAAYKRAFDTIESRGKVKPKIEGEKGGLNQEDEQTSIITIDVDGSSDFDKEKIAEVVKRLIEKFPDVDKKEIIASVNEISLKRLPSILIYRELEGPQFWDVESVQGFPVITVNLRHPFYDEHMHSMRMSDSAEGRIVSIELLIKALAFEESRMNPDQQETVRDFRDGVGLKLRTYIRSLQSAEQN